MKMLEDAKAAGFEFVPYCFMAEEKSQDIPDSSKEVGRQIPSTENTDVGTTCSITNNDSSEDRPGLPTQNQNGLQSNQINSELQEMPQAQVSEFCSTDIDIITTSRHSELDSEKFLADKSSTLLARDDNKENVNKDIAAAMCDRRGTEIRLRDLELGENTSTLRANFVTMTMECARCKGRVDHQLVASR